MSYDGLLYSCIYFSFFGAIVITLAGAIYIDIERKRRKGKMNGTKREAYSIVLPGVQAYVMANNKGGLADSLWYTTHDYEMSGDDIATLLDAIPGVNRWNAQNSLSIRRPLRDLYDGAGKLGTYTVDKLYVTVDAPNLCTIEVHCSNNDPEDGNPWVDSMTFSGEFFVTWAE